MISRSTVKSFRDLPDVCHIRTWQYDSEESLIHTNSPYPNLFSRIIPEDSRRAALTASDPADMPLFFSIGMALMFCAVFGPKANRMPEPVYIAQMTEVKLKQILTAYHL